MGDFKKRPEVREFAVEVTSEDGEISTSRGRDLDDVFRAILWDIQHEQDWTTSEAAERLGIARSTYQSIMSDERYEAGKTTNIENLSKVCAAMKISPIALFESHEAYSPEASATVRFAEDAVFDR
ncbi:MAG: helix-turn-helix transcriptional regulator, partial [Planctomycetota bacterium]